MLPQITDNSEKTNAQKSQEVKNLQHKRVCTTYMYSITEFNAKFNVI